MLWSSGVTPKSLFTSISILPLLASSSILQLLAFHYLHENGHISTATPSHKCEKKEKGGKRKHGPEIIKKQILYSIYPTNTYEITLDMLLIFSSGKGITLQTN